MSSILYVTEFYHPHIGGVEFLFQSIAEEMAKEGHKVAVFTSKLPGSPARETVNGVEVIRIWVPKRGSRYFFTFLAVFSLLPVARRFDTIHTTTYNAAVPAAWAGRLLRKKVIITVHEVWNLLWDRLPGINGLSRKLLSTAETAILKMRFDRYVCVSESTMKALVAFDPKLEQKASVIYNGIDYESAPKPLPKSGKGGKDKTIIYYGRPGISKGLEGLITEFNKVTDPNLYLRLVVSKDDPIRYGAVANLITHPNISLSGSLPRADLFAAIAEADYVAIPSLAEGFGFSALEACLMEKNVICSNQGALPEVVYGKVAFYDPWQKGALTDLLNKLDDTRFESIPKRTFSIQDTVKQYMQLY